MSVQSKSASLMALFKLKCSSDVGEGLLTGLDWEGGSFRGQPGVGCVYPGRRLGAACCHVGKATVVTWPSVG